MLLACLCIFDVAFYHLSELFPGGGHGHSHEAAASNTEKFSLKCGAETKAAAEAETMVETNANATEEDIEEVNIDSIRGKPKMRMFR